MPVPIIAAGISAGASLLGNRKTSAEKSLEATNKQQSALAGQVAAMARQQHTLAGPALQKAMQYYTGLASGNTGSINSLLAPDRAALMQTYAGAQKGMDTMAPGASKDRASAALAQQKAGQLGLMPMQARNQSFEKLAGMGGNIMEGANSLLGTAGNIMTGQAYGASVLGGMQRQRQQGWQNLGSSIGNIFMPWIQGRFGNKGPTGMAGGINPFSFGVGGL